MQNNFSNENLNGNCCWQYEIRQKNLLKDLEICGLTHAKIKTLKVGDFKFNHVPKEDKERVQKIKEFIIKHEWLGKMPHRPTHRFIATYQGKLAGAVILATPNTFSHILGKDSRDKEKLISRGACISWSPKNLASALVMFSIRWMAQNTRYRLFSAYSDPQARELGTIYQACNFIYLGQNSGARFKYFDPKEPQRGWFSDRLFRKSTSFKRYALGLGIVWQKDWGHRDKIYWSEIPVSVVDKLKQAAREHQGRCQRRAIPKKHKYVYILGQGKRETQGLCQRFEELNPDKTGLTYPKARGEFPRYLPNGAFLQEPQKEAQQKTTVSLERFYSIREVSKMYGISQWLLYHHLKTDPSFPYTNIGVKKKFLIELEEFDRWLEKKSQKRTQSFLSSSRGPLEKLSA